MDDAHKTNVRDSSIEAYEKLSESNKLGRRRRQIFICYAKAGQPLCDYTVAQLLGLPINSITPRRGDLEKMGYLRDCGKLPAPPGNQNVHHFEIDPKCLEPGWTPKLLLKKKRPNRIEASVSEAARVLRAQRDKHRQDKGLLLAATPLFDGIA